MINFGCESVIGTRLSHHVSLVCRYIIVIQDVMSKTYNMYM